MNKEWIISDTHFGHRNIIDYCNRPFKNVEEMDQILIDNWNSKIKNGHDVFMLGDFALSGKDMIKELVSQLNGNKTLILGNHDRHSVKYYKECGFDDVSKYPIIIHGFYILSHQPVFLNEKYCYVNLHGHLHNNVQCCFNGDKNLYYNCCVETSDYKPIDFSTIHNYYNELNG